MKLKTDVKNLVNNNFHALTHKEFRYFWVGQCFSLIGTWIQNIGQSWLVLSMTNSPFLLGLVSTIQFIPVTILSLFAGAIVDRFPKKKIILITQSVAMILAFVMSFLVFTNNIKYWHVLVLALILGISNAFDMPARQSFTVEMAGKKDLMNAIALNSAIFNLARIIGPAIGALFMAYIGAGWCFLLNGLSFIAVIFGLLKIESNGQVIKDKDKNVFADIKEGLIYIYNNKKLLQTILTVTVIGIFAFNFNVLIPSYTKNVLNMGEKTYGFLLSSLGLGSLIGAIFASIRSKSGPRKVIMRVSCIVVSCMLILVGISKIYYVTAFLLVVNGLFNIMFNTTANSTLQLTSKDEYRGRVMSVYSLVFAGSAPLGSLFSGTIADKFGASEAFVICGICTLVLTSILFMTFNRKDISK